MHNRKGILSTIDRNEIIRDTIQTFLICCVISMLVWWSGGGEFWVTFQVSLVFGAACLTAVRLSLYFISPYTGASISVLLGFLVGVSVGLLNLFHQIYGDVSKILDVPLSELLLKILFSALVTYVFFSSHRLTRKNRELQEQKLKAVTQEKEIVEANLRLLQSQIEPHFLFNTLANIKVLIELDKDAAKRVLDDLTGLLRASIMKSHDKSISISEEVELVRAYLSIQSVRMGDRLTFEIECDEDLKRLSCAPFLIQPIVENAVHHGIEPKMNGGNISVSITSNNDQCSILVRDTGLGLQEGLDHNAKTTHNKVKGNGIALANIRERMRLMYSDESTLVVENWYKDNGDLGGCLTSLSWPLKYSPELTKSALS
ncbi:sensor histidine kinase [Marinomonas mediterranea]|jgi:Putative regulator of cell autolysis|uniref:Signal transduction histidine kinase, LytS n=1 Tax=Marinomonas mediterranea (strain ATCC 700492 / JCM 21426 / NBRC 103028 / MMB-1) TaxID=717774 RepID=F2K308_MARM1|nr:histidine kinase [Marinomonas mediterranea]ADZ92397.1 signal transduction histidine kinase, LytS [Marinomonas mediterranea MMB-1]WCN10349.1 hypothetical protein GV055_16195 [Marinomonas mediterranea]WCN14395.1 hypothetical protein GV054_16020 [Marinomonas mediterranea]WCN18447.1 hypothetical protein GV053_16085 [Marinomonas mediterranea MMB-1]